jgi:uncharacterized protein YjbI with pentapeptide repeats
VIKRGTALWIAAAVAAVVLIVFFAWVLFVPAADWLARHDIGQATGTSLETARNNARGNLLALTAGIAGFGALLFTARNFALQRRTLALAEESQRRTLELTEQGQVTDRYTKAIEQLGSDKLDIRIGGIYALERIARDSMRDHPAVMEVLTTFVREHSTSGEAPTEDDDTNWRRVDADIQAALRVIGRRESPHLAPIDLSESDLTRANLAHADLSGADLSMVNLTYADLREADLSGAEMRKAELRGARLHEADLTRANLRGATLHRAILQSADLTRVILRDATLTDANLASATLRHALLDDADLSGAMLSGADLTGASLDGADLTDTSLARTNLTGANLSNAILYRTAPGEVDVTGAPRASLPAPTGWQVDNDGRLQRVSVAEDA